MPRSYTPVQRGPLYGVGSPWRRVDGLSILVFMCGLNPVFDAIASADKDATTLFVPHVTRNVPSPSLSSAWGGEAGGEGVNSGASHDRSFCSDSTAVNHGCLLPTWAPLAWISVWG